MHTLKTLIAAMLISSPLLAATVDEHHPEQAPASAAAMPMQDPAMAAQMKKMQAIHDKIAAAKTPAERQAAMQEGMATMKDGMAMLQKQGTGCKGMGMDMSGAKDGAGMGMMDMMMKMLDQQSNMMQMPMKP